MEIELKKEQIKEQITTAIKLFVEFDNKIDNLLQGYMIYKLFEYRIKQILRDLDDETKEPITGLLSIVDVVCKQAYENIK